MIKFLALAVMVLIGHVGWWLFCYNRINACALPRIWIKRIEIFIILITASIPVFMVLTNLSPIQAMLVGKDAGHAFTPWMSFWIVWSIGSVLVLGPLWLESRLWLWPPRNLVHHQSEHINIASQVSEPLTGKWISNTLAKLPLNEITQLSVTRKTLAIERVIPNGWNQLSIAHLSDIHFTGQLTPAFYHFVLDRVLEMQPDVVMVTGDIIDKDHCLDWIEPILGRLSAPLGCFFLFGNHERRLSEPEEASRRLRGIGWHDVGMQDHVVRMRDCSSNMHGRPDLIICGNERPWFDRHVEDHGMSGPLSTVGSDRFLRIGMMHTPDQFPWARELGMDLSLAGHTHGGQVRVPGLGPLVAPSWYGSRFASGVFRLPPTVMHVSRGLAGVQPVRWRCVPEISLLRIVPQAVSVPVVASHGELQKASEPQVAFQRLDDATLKA